MSRRLVPLLPRGGAPSEPPDSSGSLTKSRRTTIRAACETCRQRKIRCTGERPTCGPCRQRGIPCEYKTLGTETHSMAQSRRYRAYEDLYDLIRRSNDDDAALVMKRIQSGEDVENLVRSIKEGDLLLQLCLRPEWRIRYDFPGRFGPIAPHLDGWPNPYLRSKLFGGSPFTDEIKGNFPGTDSIGEEDKIYAVPFHAARLADPRLDVIDLTKYTTISKSKSLLRSLLQVYLLHEYPWNSFFHADFLLDDMVRGQTRHCSPVLVNAVMAASWHGYTSAKSRADFWRPDNLGYQFLAEAKRLLELERNEPSLTTVQAAGIISLVCTVNGVDEISWQYVRLAIELGRRIGLLDPNSRLQGRDHKAVVTTAWDLFNWQTWVCYHNFRVPLLKDPPPYPLPTKNEAITYFGDIFVQYPGNNSRTTISHGIMHCCICEFRVIMNQIGAHMFDDTDRPQSMSLDDAYKARSILQGWYDGLPEELTPLNISIPSHLLLHIQYYVVLIGIFEPHTNVNVPESANSPKNIISVAKTCFETLLRIYYMRHGFDTYDYALLVYLPLLAFSSLRDAKNTPPGIELEGRQTTQLLCAKGLSEQGRNMLICKAIFSQFREALNDPEMQYELNQMIDDSPDIARMSHELRSSWPVGFFNMPQGGGDLSVIPFLRRAGTLNQEGGTGMHLDGEPSPNLSRVVELDE